MAESGFFERWGKRKTAARQGMPVPEPLPQPVPSKTALEPKAGTIVPSPDRQPVREQLEPPQAQTPALTLDDVNALTQSSDFQPFMAQQVSPEVRNAAMRKLFTDPHYNVMDGLDTYIDDYSKPDPIPVAMLRQMVGAQFLNLFPEESSASAVAPTDGPHNPVKPEHDHPHLQLQPDHAAPAEDSGKRVA